MMSITIQEVERRPAGKFVDITFHANAFCRHMCRILAGTLAEVGMGKKKASEVPAILASRDRRQGGQTAPPGGLTLLEIAYPGID
jgi:tRNA pseudouridine38-40 synthase